MRRSSVDVVARFKPVLIALVSVFVLTSVVACGEDDPQENDDEPQVGEPCDDEGETHNGLICEDGYWAEDDEEEPDCEHDDDCEVVEQCDDEGQCVDNPDVECTEDTVDEYCGDDEICEDNQCVEDVECTEETEDEDCGDDEICEDNQCVDAPEDLVGCTDGSFYGELNSDYVTTDPFGHDAGLDDVRTFLEDEFDGMSDLEQTSLQPEDAIEIDGAIVTATEDHSDSHFWVADSEDAFYVRVNEALDPEPAVGDEVSFDVEEAGTFSYDPQITDVSDWSVDSSDEEVSYHEVAEGVDAKDEHGQLLRVGAEITSDEASFCGGGNFCYDVEYGEDGDYTAEFRFDGDVYDDGSGDDPDPYGEGDCVTFVGPLGAHPGVYDEDDSAAQFDSSASTDGAWHSVEEADDNDD